ncbi:MAG: peptidyl-prolyl cis-trans isomerase [Blastocatellia bacterium]|nr:peptidyl-prolyl cis-trans isomerase [Blastocatellia bacterium]
MPQKFFALALLILVVCLVGCQSKASNGRNDALLAADEKTPVIVEINGQPEYKAAFDRFLKSRLSDLLQQQSQEDSNLSQSSLLDEFVRQRLIVQTALAKGIAVTEEEVRREETDQHQQTNVEGSNQNQAALVGKERAAEIEHNLIIRKFYKAEILKNVAVTPEEIEQHYKNNPKRYPQEPSFCVREIKVDDAEKAEQLRKQALDKPADFAILSKEHSTAPSKGSLHCYYPKELPEVLENAAMPLKDGGISTVVKSNFGYHIFQMVKKQEPQPFDKIRKQVEDDLLRSKNQSVIDAYLNQALGNAKIKVQADKLGFNYTGKWK